LDDDGSEEEEVVVVIWIFWKSWREALVKGGRKVDGVGGQVIEVVNFFRKMENLEKLEKKFGSFWRTSINFSTFSTPHVGFFLPRTACRRDTP
jgi:hypothetical protein